MQVFKFGGASLRNEQAVRNMAAIVKRYGRQPLVVVVSAMGKTTRHLEAYIEARVHGLDADKVLQEIKDYHQQIMQGLFGKRHEIFTEVEQCFDQLADVVWDNTHYERFADRIVATGELVSSAIVTAFLQEQGLRAARVLAPELIKCDDHFGNGHVQWEETSTLIQQKVRPLLDEQIVVAQGYIGSSASGDIITLGKEGSDYTAAIFAACLDAGKVTIWKDVQGILTADPKLIPDALFIEQLSYPEASEMTYYGASVIHPKTIKPLANRNIPLFVRSFDNPELSPTCIIGTGQDDTLPAYILKKNQCLFTFRVRDYTFVDEASLALIFSTLHRLDISINLLQSSAITISVCFDHRQEHIEELLQTLKDSFSMHYMTGLDLITLKNYTAAFLEKYRPQQEVILAQQSRKNYRFLVKGRPAAN